MKKIFTYFALALLFLPAVMTAQAPTPELLYYKFNGTGSSVPNEALTPPPGTNTATIVGQAQGSSGQCGGALIGNGQSSTINYMNTNWTTSLTGSWTLSFWTSNVPSTTSTYYILGDVNASGFRVFTGGVAGAGNWILRGGLTDVYANGGAAAGPTLTTFVYDMPNNQIRSYVNGVLDQTVAQTAVTVSGSGPFKVGGYSSSSSLPSGSLMDEFRLYDRALSLAEIQSLLIANTSSTLNIASCTSVYTAPSGARYSVAGTYNDTIPNVNGCDSVMTINLSFLPPVTSSIAVTSCDNYISPGGATYTVSGTYTDTIPTVGGCDSVITIALTVNQRTTSSISPAACNSYISPGGATFTSSGTYMDTIPNVLGCDSVITINLTVYNSTASSISATACDTYTAPSGAMFMSSGSYIDTIPNMAGCDSLISINLTVLHSTSSTMGATACSSFTAPSGAVFTTSGTYTDIIPNMAGCDSVITINLSINASAASVSPVACYSYTAPSGAVFTVSGTYTDVIPNTMGCDSVITIQLTVDTVNTNVTQVNQVLTAGASGAAYQWMDCATNTIIAGETSQVYTATLDGDYAVIVTENGCTDTSACFHVINIGMEENAFGGKLNVYPNPSNGDFFVDLGGLYSGVTILVTDVTGRVLVSQQVNEATLIPVKLEAANGIYMMTVTAGTNKSVIKVVKE